MDGEDFSLPALIPHLKLTRAPDDRGEPAYTLHNPVSNAYYKIDWVAFEILSRLSQHKTAMTLKEAVEKETTLKISSQQIRDIIQFLEQNGLLSLRDQKMLHRASAKMPWWKRAFHNYLYLSIPLFEPQHFLEKTYKNVAWAFHPFFLKSMMALLAVMIVMTLPRLDEFLRTFPGMMSAEGALAALIVLFFVKVVHEFAHAYTATRYGVKVPHMGVALIVMYPVLYTETTGSWAISSRRARFHIGMAGIMAELCLAALFLVLWHISPAGGMAQSLAFIVVVVSLISSLVVNLNPLMRFDGYYMFSDATGFDNLQNRSCAFARYNLRKFLFGWNDAPPEDISKKNQDFLSAFGFALLIYRFFLFCGIAILVYNVFFQPLGFILMLAELTWFIFMPVLSELKIWWNNRARILSSRRALIPAFVTGVVFIILLLPWKTTLAIPAMVHAGKHETIYPPSPSRVVRLLVQDGESVETGQILAELDSPELDYQIQMAEHELGRLETLRRRGQSMVQPLQSHELSETAIEKARLKLQKLVEQKELLVIKSPFKGIIRDMRQDVIEDRYIAPSEALFTVVNPETTTVSAYATENEREKIMKNRDAVFVSQFHNLRIEGLLIDQAADAGDTAIAWPELSSIYNGPIAADLGAEGVITSRRSIYEVNASAASPAPDRTERGYLYVSSPPSSILINFFKELVSFIRHETNAG